MRRLIWGFAGSTYQIVGNLMHWLNYFNIWCMRAEKALLTILHGSTGPSEPSLHANAISFDFSRVGLYSKTCHKHPLKRRPKIVFLMQVKSIEEFSNGSILHYFRSSLSYHLSLRSLICLFLRGRLRQVLLYTDGL